MYAGVFSSAYGLETIGLRYFNVFGPRQDPDGPYTAVIPLFAKALLEGKPATINGDGSHSRDFTYVDNAVQANLLALFAENPEAINQIYNVACGQQTSLLELYNIIAAALNRSPDQKIIFGPERQGDVKHSLADISKAARLLGYEVEVEVAEGLGRTMRWFNGGLARAQK